MLFIVKGKAPFFPKDVRSEPADQKAPLSPTDVSKSDEIAPPDGLSSLPNESRSTYLQEHFILYDKGSWRMRLPLVILALALIWIFFFYQSHSHGRMDRQQSSEQQLASGDSNTGRNGGNVITPQLAQSMSNGSKMEFSGCVGKTLDDCVESEIYAKTYLDGIEFVLLTSRAGSCGAQARFLEVFGPKGVATTGCWMKNGGEINLWMFTPPDASGKYIKVKGPTVRSVDVMPYYKTHNLPDLPLAESEVLADKNRPNTDIAINSSDTSGTALGESLTSQDRDHVESIVKYIFENGRHELRDLEVKEIRNAATALVVLRRSGVLTNPEITLNGGIEQMTINSLVSRQDQRRSYGLSK